jgi:transposase
MAPEEASMSGRRYTVEYKAEAVKQVLEKGHPTTEVAQRLGINKHSLYDWVQRAKRGPAAAATGPVVTEGSDAKELRRLRAELKRVTEERDILKKAAAYFAKG